MQTRDIFTTGVSLFEHQRTEYDKLQAPQRVNMDARYTRVYYTAGANPASEWRDLATLARIENACVKVSCKLPLRMRL